MLSKITLDQFAPGFIEGELEMRSSLDDRRDIIDRDVIAYYEDPNAPGTWIESKIRQFDTVEVWGAPVLVLGPAMGRDHFHGACLHPDLGLTLSAYALGDVTDRIAYDENEAAPHFPIIPAAQGGGAP